MSPIGSLARTYLVLPKPFFFPYRIEWLHLGFFFSAALFCLTRILLLSLVAAFSASLRMNCYTLRLYCCRQLVFAVSRTIRIVETLPAAPAPSRMMLVQCSIPNESTGTTPISMLLVDLHHVFSLLRLGTLCRNHEHKTIVLAHRTYLKPVLKGNSSK